MKSSPLRRRNIESQGLRGPRLGSAAVYLLFGPPSYSTRFEAVRERTVVMGDRDLMSSIAAAIGFLYKIYVGGSYERNERIPSTVQDVSEFIERVT
jgi:hypothetical protein